MSDDEQQQQAEQPGAEPAPMANPEPTVGSEPTGDAIFDALWNRVLEAWDDDKPHGAVLEHALAAQRLPDLAGRYRALESDPVKGERAKKKLNGIVVAATQLMFATKTPERKAIPRSITLSAAAIVLFLLALLLYAFLRVGHGN